MKVSILMTTYNHENFITKAIDSVLMQETTFEYQIVIGEDCSTDNTRNILLSYQERFPGKFKLLLHDRNLGGLENGRQVLHACTGEYIASLDGDDYWTSPVKLQKQADYLDDHPECSSCFHDVLIIHEDGSKEPIHYRQSQKEFSTVEDLLLDNFIPTSAIMFRKCQFGKIPDWFGTLKIADWPIHILNAHHGKIKYFNDVMGVYVVHLGGVWSTKDSKIHAKIIIEMFEALSINLDGKYAGAINRILRWRCFVLSEQYENAGDSDNAGKYVAKSLLRHLSVLGEFCTFGRKIKLNCDVNIPDYMMAVTSLSLLKILLRLYVAPKLKAHIPTAYQYLRIVAVRIF